MQFEALGDICEFLDHRRKPVSEELRKTGPYPYFGANGQQGWIDGFIFDEPLVLLAEDGGHFGSKTNPIAYKISGKTWVNNHAHVLRPLPHCDLDYLTYALSLLDVTKLINGTTRPKLTKGSAETIRIPLPALAEQKRIAAILERTDRLRRLRRYALAMAESILRPIFNEMFGEATLNPKGWRTGCLGEVIVNGPQNGIYKPATEYGVGTPILRIDSFYEAAVEDLRQLKRLRLSDAEVVTYGLRQDDIVINRVNSRPFLGKSALIPPLGEPTVFESNMMRLSVDTRRLNPTYLIHFLHTDFVKHQIQSCGKDAVNQASINQEDVKGFLVRFPPLSLQQTFMKLTHRIERHRGVQRESLRQAEHLFQTLLHRAFTSGL